MKTPTHMAIAFLAARLLPGREGARYRWAVLGALAPDVPLILVGLYCGIAVGVSALGGGCSTGFEERIGAVYFGSDLFIALHHLLHSPLSLLILAWGVLAAGWCFCFSPRKGLWFLFGAASHAGIDLVTHARDGLLVLWPLNWRYRFDAGVDQWDAAGAAYSVLAIEVAILSTLLAILFWHWMERRLVVYGSHPGEKWF